MPEDLFPGIGYREAVLFGIFLLAFVLLLFAIFCFNLWTSRQEDDMSPYTGTPLRRLRGASLDSWERIIIFLLKVKDFDNRVFRLSSASFCRDTGRIFPDTLTWWDRIKVDWRFLQNQCPGKWVSWGSLPVERQQQIREKYDTLAGYQTDFSSPAPSPRFCGKEYAYAKPGPLYVDLETDTLMGWMQVPDSEFEILVVKRPKKLLHLTSLESPHS